MVILGIDPGLEKTGYAFLSEKEGKIYKIESGVIYTEASLSPIERLKNIYLSLKSLVERKQPRLLVMEKLFFFKNKKTVIEVAQCQGVVMLLAAEFSLPVKTLTPLEIKKIVTGNGRADKKSVEKMLYLTLPLEKQKREDDETDAIACAYAGLLSL